MIKGAASSRVPRGRLRLTAACGPRLKRLDVEGKGAGEMPTLQDYQRRAHGPTAAPSTAGRRIPALYQVATKVAVLSGQCRP